ncbi:hypothetical protein D6D02_07288 [Aureobasidium pullulans]|uniref:Uncharacterized protein n=1 Tax=Aureobasidium pullulans TaxID=5580 RepID=A0A4S9SU00_AURPU|nr:hypothetical protein D6D10_07980 [Aureobasidium pullulans]THX96467.1 hypothetical protein D6D03_08754 [Aureobasidium pullulans]THY07257.1 hypothetical protein D6D02_07288 [Aureobasidium pullulans]THY43224.1 hypothetical protein D6C98_08643 [Aureobasidium pullulans]THZ15370.1 hypothetical protein D6C89_09762 [Aureobasidium pullulans]
MSISAMNTANFGQSFSPYTNNQSLPLQHPGFPNPGQQAPNFAQNASQQQQQYQQMPGGFAPGVPPYSQSMSPSAVMSMTASPSHRVSPYAASAVAQGSPQQSPMAAPQSRPVHSPSAAASPANLSQEKERIALLLDINVELLQEMHRLQAQGKGGATSQSAAAHLKSQGLPDALASDEYTQVYLRLHANLGYVCGQTDNQSKPGSSPHPPSYVTAPPNMPQIEPKYAKLRALFPGWAGKDGQRRSMSNGATNAPTPFQGFGN